MNDTTTANTNWKCSKCGLLLGKHFGAEIEIEILKRYRYLVEGKVTGVCQRCGERTVTTSVVSEAKAQ